MTEIFLFLLLSPIENEEERRVLTELYQKYRKRVRNYIHRYFQINEEDAEDCVQQSYLNIARNIGKVSTLAPNFQLAYLLKTAFTVTLNFVREKQKITFPDTDGEGLEQIIYDHMHQPVPSYEAGLHWLYWDGEYWGHRSFEIFAGLPFLNWNL